MQDEPVSSSETAGSVRKSSGGPFGSCQLTSFCPGRNRNRHFGLSSALRAHRKPAKENRFGVINATGAW